MGNVSCNRALKVCSLNVYVNVVPSHIVILETLQVIVLGTPAEEGGCGKALLIKGTALEGIDVAMMVHPYKASIAKPNKLTSIQ